MYEVLTFNYKYLPSFETQLPGDLHPSGDKYPSQTLDSGVQSVGQLFRQSFPLSPLITLGWHFKIGGQADPGAGNSLGQSVSSGLQVSKIEFRQTFTI